MVSTRFFDRLNHSLCKSVCLSIKPSCSVPGPVIMLLSKTNFPLPMRSRKKIKNQGSHFLKTWLLRCPEVVAPRSRGLFSLGCHGVSILSLALNAFKIRSVRTDSSEAHKARGGGRICFSVPPPVDFRIPSPELLQCRSSLFQNTLCFQVKYRHI